MIVTNPDGSLPPTEAGPPVAATATGGLPQQPATVAPQNRYPWHAVSTGISREYRGGSVIGWTANTRVSYDWYTAAFSGQRAAGTGLGFSRGYRNGVFGTWAHWYALGNAGPTGATGWVPWGNTAATKIFRAQCTNVTACWGWWQ